MSLSTKYIIEGSDALNLWADHGIHDSESFGPEMAKQSIACNPDGYLLGDGIRFYCDRKPELTGPTIAPKCVGHNLKTAKYDASVTADERHRDKDKPEIMFRYQIQEPNVAAVMNEAIFAVYYSGRRGDDDQ